VRARLVAHGRRRGVCKVGAPADDEALEGVIGVEVGLGGDQHRVGRRHRLEDRVGFGFGVGLGQEEVVILEIGTDLELERHRTAEQLGGRLVEGVQVMLAEPVQKEVIGYRNPVFVRGRDRRQGQEPGVEGLLLDQPPHDAEDILPVGVQRFHGESVQGHRKPDL